MIKARTLTAQSKYSIYINPPSITRIMSKILREYRINFTCGAITVALLVALHTAACSKLNSHPGHILHMVLIGGCFLC